MVSGNLGVDPFTGTASHFRTVSMLASSRTRPKTVCFPSRWGAAAHVIKNWQPFVFGPLLAMDKSPGPLCLWIKFSSGKEEP